MNGIGSQVIVRHTDARNADIQKNTKVTNIKSYPERRRNK